MTIKLETLVATYGGQVVDDALTIAELERGLRALRNGETEQGIRLMRKAATTLVNELVAVRSYETLSLTGAVTALLDADAPAEGLIPTASDSTRVSAVSSIH